MLNIVHHTLDLTVDADNIPEEIIVDLTGLDVGDSVHISSIKLPAGAVDHSHEDDLTIATIVAPSGLQVRKKRSDGAAEAAAPAAAKAPRANEIAFRERASGPPHHACPCRLESQPMHLIVGLGNPGDKYRNNRHNIGFLAVDAIARRHGFPGFREKFQGLISEGTIDGEKVLLLKPQTFMNSSGDSVQKAATLLQARPRRRHRALRRDRPRPGQDAGEGRRRQWRP